MMKLLTIPQAADVLGVPPDGVRTMIARREIPVVRVSERRLRIRESDLTTFIERRTIRATV